MHWFVRAVEHSIGPMGFQDLTWRNHRRDLTRRETTMAAPDDSRERKTLMSPVHLLLVETAQLEHARRLRAADRRQWSRNTRHAARTDSFHSRLFGRERG